jgi:hypothetical protein
MPIDATRPYDDTNIFARILRGELPCNKVYEDDHVLAFRDIRPLAPVYLLIPRAPTSPDDFSERAGADEIAGFVRAVGRSPATRAWSPPATACSPMSASTVARKSPTSTSTSSAAARSARCWRGDRGPSASR